MVMDTNSGLTVDDSNSFTTEDQPSRGLLHDKPLETQSPQGNVEVWRRSWIGGLVRTSLRTQPGRSRWIFMMQKSTTSMSYD
ncbi:hypothetical protein TNCV_791031 [Trichonephila clavipes]|nr:hypothetical protein TNCV_791031 [Trichonephila clavipes]